LWTPAAATPWRRDDVQPAAKKAAATAKKNAIAAAMDHSGLSSRWEDALLVDGASRESGPVGCEFMKDLD
jgi:hypothetical protein